MDTAQQQANGRGVGQRAGLTRDAVVRAAREILDADGYPALSMRSLARALGVRPNTLYSHVSDKLELVDALLDDRLGAVVISRSRDPQRRVRDMMRSTYDVLVGTPGLVPLYLTRQGASGENAQRLGRALRADLGELGLPEAQRQPALSTLVVHTIGFAAYATADPARDDARPARPAAEARAEFHRSLDWLLDGMLSRDGARAASGAPDAGSEDPARGRG